MAKVTLSGSVLSKVADVMTELMDSLATLLARIMHVVIGGSYRRSRLC